MTAQSFTILEYGVFDSNVKFPKMVESQPRDVNIYELELYTSDTFGKAYMNGIWYSVGHGSFICAKPGDVRKSRLPFKCHYIHLSTHDPDLKELLDALPRHFTLWQLQGAMQLFHEMLTVETAELVEDKLLLQSCVCRLLRILSQYRNALSREKVGSTFIHQKALLSVDRYIRENLDKELSLTELAAHCNLSPTYFHSVFTDFFSKTPARYILECRISAAKTGLLSGDRSLAKLALDCGFSSQSYFCYKFKQVTGKTPLQYRKEMLGRLVL